MSNNESFKRNEKGLNRVQDDQRKIGDASSNADTPSPTENLGKKAPELSNESEGSKDPSQ
jgi:hypothetical protein